ncbi:MAG TPA: cation:proton antiporter [Caldilineaceae bacterium]|nr:cation:proton antiporter [Caldilineaceae bacterium]
MEHNELLIIAAVLATGSFCQWLAWRVKIPAILPLLAAGFLAGPVFDLLHPQKEMGVLYFPIISLSVAVILFEGALTLTWREVRSVASTVRNLLILGALVTWIGSAVAARYLLALPWDLSLLFGALIIVTGPTVIAPLLRNVRPTANISSILRWEGIIIDPIGASAAVLVFDFILARGSGFSSTLISMVRIVGIGAGLGLVGGYVLSYLVRRFLVPDYLRDVTVLVSVLGIFAISNTFAAESGLLAVTVMGIYMANTDLRQLREIWYFKERLSVLLISTLFILLAANVTMADLMLLDWRAFAVLVIVLFVIRPLGVQLSALGSNLTRNERLFLSWVAPRGIVAAAVSSLFVFDLLEFGYDEARLLSPLVFLIIVGTVLIQGSTAKPLARYLKVSEADPQGFLLMGATPFSMALAEALQDAGFLVRLIDSNQQNVIHARLQGLDIEHGNLLSTFVEETLDIDGIGRLLALTSNDEANALACQHFEDEFGSENVYQLQPSRPTGKQHTRNLVPLGRLLFADDATYGNLEQMVQRGATIKRTLLTSQFTFSDYRTRHPADQALVLMAIQGKQVIIPTADQPLQPQAGWELLSLTAANGRLIIPSDD